MIVEIKLKKQTINHYNFNGNRFIIPNEQKKKSVSSFKYDIRLSL